MTVDYYKVLGVPKAATLDDIKKAYRNLALKYHPLRNTSAGSKESFVAVSEAFDVLLDAKKRAVFDQYGADGLAHGVSGGYEGEAYPGGYYFPPSQAEYIFYKFFGVTNPFDDLFAPSPAQAKPSTNLPLVDQGVQLKGFGSAFGGMQGLTTSSDGPLTEPKQGPAVEYPLPLTLEELFRGTIKKVAIKRKVLNEDGKTTTLQEKIFTVEVKKGWKATTKIIFPREGDQGPNQVPSDIVFVVEEMPHACFRRSGHDLLYAQELTLAEALTGSKVQLTTLDDRSLIVAIHEVVRPGYTKTIQGEGMPKSKNPSERGNLVLSFNVQFPSYLSEEQKSQLKKTFTSSSK